MAKPRLLYILPEYDSQTASHAYHIFKMLELLGREFSICLLVEKTRTEPVIAGVSVVYSQRTTFPVLNLLERLAAIVYFRLRGFRTTYVHYSYWGAILSSMVDRMFGGRTFYWHCEVYDRFSMPFELSARFFEKKLFDEWPMRLALKSVSYLVTGTTRVAEFYLRTFNLDPKRIKVVPNWVNRERFKVGESKRSVREGLGLPLERKVVLFAHRLVPRKGADFLPGIIRQVMKALPEVFFVIAGSGPLMGGLHRRLAKRRNVKLVGDIPNWKMPRYFAASDLFIMPSRQEGFPRVLLEAMAAGIAFVATQVGGTRDILAPHQREYLVEPGDVEGFSEKVIQLLKNEEERDRLENIGKKQVARFDEKKIANKFSHLLSG